MDIALSQRQVVFVVTLERKGLVRGDVVLVRPAGKVGDHRSEVPLEPQPQSGAVAGRRRAAQAVLQQEGGDVGAREADLKRALQVIRGN